MAASRLAGAETSLTDAVERLEKVRRGAAYARDVVNGGDPGCQRPWQPPFNNNKLLPQECCISTHQPGLLMTLCLTGHHLTCFMPSLTHPSPGTWLC
jgi:hypothetical protein